MISIPGLTQNLDDIATIMETFSVIAGLGFLLGAIFQLKKYGESRTMMSTQYTIAGPFLALLAGAMLLALPTVLNLALTAFWGNGDNNPMSYSGGPSGYTIMMPAILMFVRVVGLGAFIRGIFLLSRSGGHQSQPGTLAKALISMFAGILCIHVIGTMDLLSNTFGVGPV